MSANDGRKIPKGENLKYLITALALSLSVTLSPSATAEVVKEITIAVSDVFVPETVERGMDAKIVISGMFPNSCYRWSRFEVTSPVQTIHEIKSKAFVTMNTMCLMVLVPFSKELNLGRLNPGEHTLRFTSGDDTYFERKLIVQ